MPRIIQMIKDSIAIQKAYRKKKQETNITERILVDVERRKEKKNQGIL